MSKPLCVDLYCGLGGWTEGFLAEGYDCIGFDIERHVYGDHAYPAQLVLQDVCTLHGSQFKDAAIIVASSPCQAYSYMAMPWTRAKQIARALRGEDVFPDGYRGARSIAELNELFEQPGRIQREACEAAGRFIPMIQENVKGAQPWVGSAAWSFGSYYLWGDVPALMPTTVPRAKVGGDWNKFRETGEVSRFNAISEAEVRATKNTGGSWFSEGARIGTVKRADPRDQMIKQGGDWFREPGISAAGSKSTARKAASARIAKIPFALSSHIARVYYPQRSEAA